MRMCRVVSHWWVGRPDQSGYSKPRSGEWWSWAKCRLSAERPSLVKSEHPGQQWLSYGTALEIVFAERRCSNLLCKETLSLPHLGNENIRIPRAIRRPQSSQVIWGVLLSPINKVERTIEAFPKCLRRRLDGSLQFFYLHTNINRLRLSVLYVWLL